MHTPTTLARAALDAVGAQPLPTGGFSKHFRLLAIEWVATAMREELEETYTNPDNLEFALASIQALADGTA